MMKSIFFIFLFSSSLSLAQYDQLVKPVLIGEVVSFAQYRFRQEMIAFFKTATGIKLISSQRLELRLPLLCKIPQLNTDAAELFIERKALAQGLRETLFFKACNRRIELFAIEREGVDIKPTSDNDLMRGLIPDSKKTQNYRLYLIDRALKIELSEFDGEQNMFFSILFNHASKEIRLKVLEKISNEVLTHQFVNSIFYQYGFAFDDSDAEYIWNFDPENSIPRQYLYLNQKEVSPERFLQVKSKLYTRILFPLIEDSLKFTAVKLD